MQTLDILLLLSMGLFTLGMAGVLLRRNALFILMSIELMLNAANVAMVAFSRARADSLDTATTGHVAAIVIIVVAAAEAAVGIALILALFRQTRGNIDVDNLGELKG